MNASVSWESLKDSTTVVGPIVAVVALFVTWLVHRQGVTFNMIDGVYALCHKLHGYLFSEWRLTHLFCIDTGVYEPTRNRVQVAFDAPEVNDVERNELIEKERLFAIHVFIVFEQAYYQWKETSFFFWKRKRFLGEMLGYFTNRLLQNPRLVAFLKSDPVGHTLHLEEESRLFLDECLQNCDLAEDEDGPFRSPVPHIAGTPKKPTWRQRLLWRFAPRARSSTKRT